MNINSQRSIFSILAGMLIGLLAAVFLKSTCWAPLACVLAASIFAKVSSPKDGAILGAIVMIPIGLYLIMQSQYSQARNDPFVILIDILGIVFAFLFVPCIGALYGSIIGKLFEIVRDERLI